MLVIDEADYLLSYGFESDVRQIKEYLPKILQGFLMSATLSTVRSSVVSFPLLITFIPTGRAIVERTRPSLSSTSYYYYYV